MLLQVDVHRLGRLMAQNADGPLSASDLADRVRRKSPNHVISVRTVQRALHSAMATRRTLRLLADVLGVDTEELIALDVLPLVVALAKCEQDIIDALVAEEMFDVKGTLHAVAVLNTRFAYGVAVNLKGDKGSKSDLSYALDFLDMVHAAARGICEDVLPEQ